MGENRSRLDAVLDCLAVRRRRDVLRVLRDVNPMSLADLAEEVAVREYEEPLEELPAQAVERIATSLHHNHLRKLEAANLVEYAQSRDTVATGEAIEQAASLLALVVQERRR